MFQDLKFNNRGNRTIESIWFDQVESQIDFKILPDGCIDLIFDLHQNKALVCGHMTKFQDLTLAKNTSLMGVRFRVESFAELSTIPLSEFKNRRVDFSDLNLNSSFIELLNETKNVKQRLALVNKYICDQLTKNESKKDDLIASVVQSIRRLSGKIVIKEMAREYLISPRQLERRFKNYMGLTIKEFANIIRFMHASKAISKFQAKSLSEIAFDSGYYDHAHMSNNFIQIAGANPGTFR